MLIVLLPSSSLISRDPPVKLKPAGVKAIITGCKTNESSPVQTSPGKTREHKQQQQQQQQQSHHSYHTKLPTTTPLLATINTNNNKPTITTMHY